MRRAELVAALILAACSIGLMYKSAELPIGWIKGEGPGGGAFPFWLSAGMLICCVWIIINWIRKVGPVATATGPYMDKETMVLISLAAGSLTAMIGLIHLIGVYGSVPLFLIFYVRFIGRHSWPLTGSLAIGTPVVAFFFFEIALRITLPKGKTEPLFYPLYDIFL